MEVNNSRNTSGCYDLRHAISPYDVAPRQGSYGLCAGCLGCVVGPWASATSAARPNADATAWPGIPDNASSGGSCDRHPG
eukprot:scaffold207_cov409-Prasinococcus_capsulatus_cf.AAC.39